MHSMLSDKIRKIFDVFASEGAFVFLSDYNAVRLMWWIKTGKKINLKQPRGFNEKLQWLKLYDRKSEYTSMADKLLVRNYVEKTIGKQYLVPIIGVWNNANEIDFSKLPDKFVLKCNHNSGGGMFICRGKRELNEKSVINALNDNLLSNYYSIDREWVYKDIEPKIIGEELLEENNLQNSFHALINYKFYCFNGEPKFLYVGVDDVSDGTKGESRCSYLNIDWSEPEFSRPDHETVPFKVEKPSSIDEMIEIARKLSKDIPFVRVDLYWVNNKVYFSEMTFYPGAGYGIFEPNEWEEKIGSWIVLPQSDRK